MVFPIRTGSSVCIFPLNRCCHWNGEAKNSQMLSLQHQTTWMARKSLIAALIKTADILKPNRGLASHVAPDITLGPKLGVQRGRTAIPLTKIACCSWKCLRHQFSAAHRTPLPYLCVLATSLYQIQSLHTTDNGWNNYTFRLPLTFDRKRKKTSHFHRQLAIGSLSNADPLGGLLVSAKLMNTLAGYALENCLTWQKLNLRCMAATIHPLLDTLAKTCIGWMHDYVKHISPHW